MATEPSAQLTNHQSIIFHHQSSLIYSYLLMLISQFRFSNPSTKILVHIKILNSKLTSPTLFWFFISFFMQLPPAFHVILYLRGVWSIWQIQMVKSEVYVFSAVFKSYRLTIIHRLDSITIQKNIAVTVDWRTVTIKGCWCNFPHVVIIHSKTMIHT